MLFSKTLISSIFGLAGVGVAGSIIAANSITQPTKPNKLSLSEKCGFNKELESLFSEIKELYESFKSDYGKLKDKLSKISNSKQIKDEDSCFNSYWNFSYSSLTSFISSVLSSRDSEVKKLSESGKKLNEKIDEFYDQKEKISKEK